MDDKSLLELCLSVSGKFEAVGAASYTNVSGNFDGMGISCGILQWNAGQGTLQALVRSVGSAMGWDRAKTFFSSDIQAFSQLKAGPTAIAWCLDHYIEAGTKNIDPGAKAKWQAFLGQPESVAAQVATASSGVLGHAKREVAAYAPDYIDRQRPYAFF